MIQWTMIPRPIIMAIIKGGLHLRESYFPVGVKPPMRKEMVAMSAAFIDIFK